MACLNSLLNSAAASRTRPRADWPRADQPYGVSTCLADGGLGSQDTAFLHSGAKVETYGIMQPKRDEEEEED